MGKNLDQVKVGSPEQFAKEIKSASDVVRLLLKKPITYNCGLNDQQWTLLRAWVYARRATSQSIAKEQWRAVSSETGMHWFGGGSDGNTLWETKKVRHCSYPTS